MFCVVSLLALTGFAWQQQRELHTLGSQLTALQPSGVDVGFAQFMGLHHRQALAMAELMLDTRPTGLSLLARRIQASQAVELGEMRGWLQLWGQPTLPTSRSMSWMLLGKAPLDAELRQYLLECEKSAAGMPGLATDAEIHQLRTLAGSERDHHFLQLMYRHHQGGIPMARFTASQAKLPVVRKLAARIVLDQSEESASMRLLMQRLGVPLLD